MTQVKSFLKRIHPAILHNDGTVKTGPRGSQHIEIRYNYPEPDGTVMRGAAGFWDPLESKFYHKYGPNGLHIDSQRLEPENSMMGKRKLFEQEGYENFKMIPADVYHKLLSNPDMIIKEQEN